MKGTIRKSVWAFLVAATLLATPSSTAQDASTRLIEALSLERSVGDYEGAIAIYREIAGDASADRRVVGQAVLQLGKAYESLGRTEAFAAYERVARDFGDQEDLVAEARERMRGLAEPVGATVKLAGEYALAWLHDDDAPTAPLHGASVSAVTGLIARDAPHGIAIENINTGQVRVLEKAQTGCESSSTYQFSPDGTSLAFVCWIGPESTVHIVSLQTGMSRKAFRLSDHFPEEIGIVAVIYDWSQQDELLLSFQSYSDSYEGERVVLAPLDGSPPIVLDTHDFDTPDHFVESSACVLDDKVFAQYVQPAVEASGTDRLEVRRLMRDGSASISALSDPLSDYSVVACDPAGQNLVYLKSSLGESTLWTARVGMEGTLMESEMIRSVPNGVTPLTSNGSGIFLTSSMSRPWAVVEVPMDSAGGLSGQPSVVLEGYPHIQGYSPDGQELYVFDRDRAAWLGYSSSGGARALPSGFRNPAGAELLLSDGSSKIQTAEERGDTSELRSWVVRRDDFSIVDSLLGVAAFAVSQDRTLWYTVSADRCIQSFDRRTRTSSTIRCKDGATEAYLWSDNARGLLAFRFRLSDGWAIEVYDPSTEEIREVWKGGFPDMREISWSGGHLYFLSVRDSIVEKWNPRTDEWTRISLLDDLKSVLPFRWPMRFAVRPDGAMVALLIRPGISERSLWLTAVEMPQ